MIETILNEAERYGFPIIITDGAEVRRNSEARRTRSLSRVSPLFRLNKKAKEAVLRLAECSAAAVKTKRGAVLVYRRFDYLVFMYLPMLENIGMLPSEVFSLDASASDLSELLSRLAASLFPKGEIKVSSYARISSMTATLCFLEDTVKTELDGDGVVDSEKAFYALGQALSELDFKGATELSDPPVTVTFLGDKLTVALYGEEIYSERTGVLAAVTPYSFTEKEYFAAFVLAVAAAIFKGRK